MQLEGRRIWQLGNSFRIAFLLFPIKVPQMVVMLIVARIACDNALPKNHTMKFFTVHELSLMSLKRL